TWRQLSPRCTRTPRTPARSSRKRVSRSLPSGAVAMPVVDSSLPAIDNALVAIMELFNWGLQRGWASTRGRGGERRGAPSPMAALALEAAAAAGRPERAAGAGAALRRPAVQRVHGGPPGAGLGGGRMVVPDRLRLARPGWDRAEPA